MNKLTALASWKVVTPVLPPAAQLGKLIAVATLALAATAAYGQQISPDLNSIYASASAAPGSYAPGSSVAGYAPASGTAAAQVEVLVQYTVAPTQADYQAVTALGGTLNQAMIKVKAAHYTVPVSSVKALAALPHIKYVSPNRVLKGKLNITAVTVHSDVANNQYHLWGNGIGVAVIDSGIGTSPFFGQN